MLWGRSPVSPDEIVAYAALDFAALSQGEARSISIARLAHDPGSPGAAFRLNETALFDALSRVATSMSTLRVAEPAGLRQLLFDEDPTAMAEQMLASYYARWATLEVIGA